jgi:hypothetical protein
LSAWCDDYGISGELLFYGGNVPGMDLKETLYKLTPAGPESNKIRSKSEGIYFGFKEGKNF